MSKMTNVNYEWIVAHSTGKIVDTFTTRGEARDLRTRLRTNGVETQLLRSELTRSVPVPV